MVASSMGFHLLGSIPNREQEVPGAEPRGDPGKGQGGVLSWDMRVRSPVGEQAVAKTRCELKVPHAHKAGGHFPANMQRLVGAGSPDPRQPPLGKEAAADKNLLSLLWIPHLPNLWSVLGARFCFSLARAACLLREEGRARGQGNAGLQPQGWGCSSSHRQR